MIKVTIPGRFAGMNEFIEANRTGKKNWNKANTMKQRDQAALLAVLRPSLRGRRIKVSDSPFLSLLRAVCAAGQGQYLRILPQDFPGRPGNRRMDSE